MIAAILPMRAKAAFNSPMKSDIILVRMFFESGENVPPTISDTTSSKLKLPKTFSMLSPALSPITGFTVSAVIKVSPLFS